jgi:hypothetical protein
MNKVTPLNLLAVLFYLPSRHWGRLLIIPYIRMSGVRTNNVSSKSFIMFSITSTYARKSIVANSLRNLYLLPEMNSDQMAMGLPPVTSAVFLIANSWYNVGI